MVVAFAEVVIYEFAVGKIVGSVFEEESRADLFHDCLNYNNPSYYIIGCLTCLAKRGNK